MRCHPCVRLRGVEAVIDRDLGAALLAGGLDADALLVLTDVASVEAGLGTAETRAIADVAPDERRAMRPKVEAACRFVEATGGIAGIGALADVADILRGRRGTRVSARVAVSR